MNFNFDYIKNKNVQNWQSWKYMLYLLFVTGISQGSTYFSMTVFVVSLASNDSSIVPSTQFLFSALYSKPEQTSSEYSSSVAVLLFKHNRPHCSDELTFKRNNVPLQNTRRIINQSKCLHKIHISLEREKRLSHKVLYPNPG